MKLRTISIVAAIVAMVPNILFFIEAVRDGYLIHSDVPEMFLEVAVDFLIILVLLLLVKGPNVNRSKRVWIPSIIFMGLIIIVLVFGLAWDIGGTNPPYIYPFILAALIAASVLTLTSLLSLWVSDLKELWLKIRYIIDRLSHRDSHGI